MSLPIFQTSSKDLSLLQTKWSGMLNPLLASPMAGGQLLQKVSLKAGSNTINHGLASTLQGWYLTRIRASATVYDTQDSNPIPSKTLLLTASAPAIVDIFVF